MNAETTNTRCTPTSQASLWASNTVSMFMNAFSTWIAEIATIEASSFCFRPAEIDLGHPVRPIRMAAGINLRDEILVTGKHHDQNQIAGQRDVDQAEHASE